MPAFVILEHDHPALHWDFMLEHHGVLKTWRLPALPLERGQHCVARALADHRIMYLEYEGPVSGDRGRVVRRDWGSYEIVQGDLQDDAFHLSLHGHRLCGLVVMHRLQDDDWIVKLPLAV